MANIILSNVVHAKKLRTIQRTILDEVASFLYTSFGPFGATSIIRAGESSATTYTKDGHDILKSIHYNGVIESTIVDDLVDITKYVVKTVGDGTTTAVEMSNIIFKKIADLEAEHKYSSHEIISAFQEAVRIISDIIKSNGRECTIDDIYNIAYTSTNGNKDLATNIQTLYKDYGMNLYIDLQVSTSATTDTIRIYDGINLPCGYTDAVFANMPNNTCELMHPNIYVFEDPVDTPEMIGLLESIIWNNIQKPYMDRTVTDINPTPTVIIAPQISNDMSSILDKLTSFMMNFKSNNKPPLVMITAYNHRDEMADIASLCGAPLIKKYINPEMQKADIENGIAPTIDTVTQFFGTCDKVVSSTEYTNFINPKLEFNEAGEHSEKFNNLLSWLETEYDRAVEEGRSAQERYALKRRITSMKSILIEYFVGGVSIADRDANRALIEDAIKNISSAVINGVGYGASIEGYRASYMAPKNEDNLVEDMIRIIKGAYEEILTILYGSVVSDKKEVEDYITMSIAQGPLNLRNFKFDKTVLSSIQSDVVILEAISKIVTLMATSTQFILPSPAHNVYLDLEDYGFKKTSED